MDINYLGVVLGGVAFWALGALWYSPLLFSKAWQAGAGMSDEEAQSGNMPLIFGMSAVIMMIMTYAVSIIVSFHPPEEQTFTHSAFHGAMAAVFYCATAMGINYLYQSSEESEKLFVGMHRPS